MTYFLRRRKYEGLPAYQIFKSIFGFGDRSARAFCRMMGINLQTTLAHLNSKQFSRMEYALNKRFVPEKDYKRYYAKIVQNHKKYQTFKGIRMSLGLPANGQSTRTNAQTPKRLKNRWNRIF